MDSHQTKGRFEAIITILSRPRVLLQGTIEYLLAWSFTRSWWRLLMVHAPWIMLLTAFTGIVVYGSLLSRATLAERYSEWVAQELPEALRSTDENAAPSKATAGDTAQAESPEESPAEAGSDAANQSADASPLVEPLAGDADLVSGYGELLLRRLLQLQESSTRITYLVAAQLAHQNRWAQARQMMRRIAPVDEGGFAPAHHWLAADQLQHRQIQTPEQREVLIKDLSMATRWAGCHPSLRNLYSQLLESQGNVGQAMAVLEHAGESSLEANLAIARLAADHNQQGRFERAAQEIKQEVQSRVKNQTVSSLDWRILASLFLFEKKPGKARAAAMNGLKVDAENPQLRRLVSESYRIEYLLSVQQADGKTKLNLGLLDAALKADPDNPNVGTEIARLIAMGEEATPEFKSALEQQLAAGQATALTHILLASRYLQAGDLQAAAPHLELALRQAPNNPITLNNLALVLSRTDQQPERAQQLSMEAVQREPNNAEFRDTLGEILARNGDKLGAIESYEAAIGLNAEASSTRKKLAELYRELGMTDMADVQQRELDK